jgi:Mitochondrial carrier protein
VRAYTGMEPLTYHKLMIGALSGLVAQSCTYPLEMVRRRMQTDGLVDHGGSAQQVRIHSGDYHTKPAHFD